MSGAGTPHIALSPAMQGFYAARGMWAAGSPAGPLAGWLSEKVAGAVASPPLRYWTTAEGLRCRVADAEAVPAAAWPTYHQKAQWLRGLREAGQRAGIAAQEGPPAPQPKPAPVAAAGVPFGRLVIPSGGVARQAFVRHMAASLRDVIDASQSSEWGADSRGA